MTGVKNLPRIKGRTSAPLPKSQTKSSKSKRPTPTSSASASLRAAGIDDDEQALRDFDLDTRFGPCTGMTRRERYDRAIRLSLSPPRFLDAVIARGGAHSVLQRWI